MEISSVVVFSSKAKLFGIGAELGVGNCAAVDSVITDFKSGGRLSSLDGRLHPLKATTSASPMTHRKQLNSDDITAPPPRAPRVKNQCVPREIVADFMCACIILRGDRINEPQNDPTAP